MTTRRVFNKALGSNLLVQMLQRFIDLGGVDTPELFSVEWTWVLPHVVVGVEVSDRVTALVRDRLEGALLVLRRWNGNLVRVTLGWPAGLSNENLLGVTTGVGDSLELQQDPVTGILGGNVTVKESVGVNSHVVRVLTQVRVVDHGNEGVDTDDRTRVTLGLQSRSTRLDVLADLGRSGLASVNQLVTDRDGADNVPTTVVLDSLGQSLNVLLNLVDVKDTGEKLLAWSETRKSSLDLVTVDTVKSDGLETRQLQNFLLDLGSRLTATVVRVWRVGDSLSWTRERTSGGWDRHRVGARAGWSWLGRSGGSGRGRAGRVTTTNKVANDTGSVGLVVWLGLSGWLRLLLLRSTSGLGDEDGVPVGDNNRLLFVLVVLVLDWLGNGGGDDSGLDEALEQHF